MERTLRPKILIFGLEGLRLQFFGMNTGKRIRKTEIFLIPSLWNLVTEHTTTILCWIESE